ncbi:glycosyltransferase [Endothiovibrio diazotrophicus]
MRGSLMQAVRTPRDTHAAERLPAAREWRELVAVTVTYQPDVALLRAQFASLPPDCGKVLVDNASAPALREALMELAESAESVPNLSLVVNSANRGLAAAINQGVAAGRVRFPQARYCLLLDQDSEPESGSLEALVEALEGLQLRGEPVAAVGPLLRDAQTGLTHGFHQSTGWRWRRLYPEPGSPTLVPCTNLNGSGTLVPLARFLQLGGLDEGLFIDHVDTEWAFRALSRGYTLWGVPGALFTHRMGQESLRYWLFGWRVWPARSALRHRYLFRNALWLMRRPYVPGVWKFWAMVKLALTFTVHALFDPRRGEQVRAMLQGLGQGLRGGSDPR